MNYQKQMSIYLCQNVNHLKKPNTCTYTLYDDCNTWECSNCRDWWTFLSGTPENNYMKYCPMCGAKIIENKIETLDEVIERMDRDSSLEK